jgi:hypothetical protein
MVPMHIQALRLREVLVQPDSMVINMEHHQDGNMVISMVDNINHLSLLHMLVSLLLVTNLTQQLAGILEANNLDHIKESTTILHPDNGPGHLNHRPILGQINLSLSLSHTLNKADIRDNGQERLNNSHIQDSGQERLSHRPILG